MVGVNNLIKEEIEKELFGLKDNYMFLEDLYKQFEISEGYNSLTKSPEGAYMDHGKNLHLGLGTIIDSISESLQEGENLQQIKKEIQIARLYANASRDYLYLLKRYPEFKEAEMRKEGGYFCINRSKDRR